MTVEQTGPPNGSAEKRQTIVAVDDDPAIRKLLVLALQKQYAVHTAADAAAARTLLGRLVPDLLVLDLKLGDDDGLSLLAEFRQRSVAPVLIITGHGSEAAAIRALHLRANAYLPKPVLLSTLRAEVARLLGEGPRPEHLAERAAEIVDSLIAGPVSAADLAARAAVKPRRLREAFQKRYGCTPMQYLRRRRLETAQRLLVTTELPVAVIASRTGFQAVAYFDRAFRREWGLTPGEFRRTHVPDTSSPPETPPTSESA